MLKNTVNCLTFPFLFFLLTSKSYTRTYTVINTDIGRRADVNKEQQVLIVICDNSQFVLTHPVPTDYIPTNLDCNIISESHCILKDIPYITFYITTAVPLIPASLKTLTST